MQLYHRDRSASHGDLGDRSAWGATHRDPGDRIKSTSHRDKIRVPGMLLTGILEIGGVLLPSGRDNLAIGVSPVGELLRLRYALASSCVQYVGYKGKKDESFNH